MSKTRVLLTREDWIEAAIDELSANGFRALGVERLARRLGISKGSFYWHFRDLPDLSAAVLAAWKLNGFVQVIADLASIGDPRQRLVALIRTAWGNPRYLRAECALVAEALAGNPQVMPVVDEVTAGRLKYLRGVYREMGMPTGAAARWAMTAYSAYVGLVQLVGLGAAGVTTEAGIRALAKHLESVLVPDATR
jgi:AcrR family transcriptional regulator